MDTTSPTPEVPVDSLGGSAPPTASKRIRHSAHSRCVICSSVNPLSLGLEFSVQPDGSVHSSYRGSTMLEGDPGQLHVGIIAAMLEEAMAHCLLAAGHSGSIGKFHVRYQQPVAAQIPITLRAWLDRSRGRSHRLRAELRQDSAVKATALGAFI